MPEEATLKRSTDYTRLGELETKIVQIQLDSAKRDLEDHEKRLRALEDTATKFNFILYLTMGGGLVSLVDLAVLVFLLVQTLAK